MTPPSRAFWAGRRVFVTGHTGFKGSWLTVWLHALGAEVHGYALPPATDPSLFDVADVRELTASSTLADIRDFAALRTALVAARPDVVFHLAAQPLVREAYRHPVETYAVNVMGAVHLLEAVRAVGGVKAVVTVTSDKCYENREWPWGYRENERMGGDDPYSSSKACVELVAAAYRRSFLDAQGIALATARAGNVIGGGDWSTDRLIPDILRAIDAGAELTIRSPGATRPWQHVLQPVSGYLMLAERLHADGARFGEGWNFGPPDDDAQSVEQILHIVAQRRPGLRWTCDRSAHPREANYLKLDSSKARNRLGWRPRWRLAQALDRTLQWHGAWRSGGDVRAVMLEQISDCLGVEAGASHVAV